MRGVWKTKEEIPFLVSPVLESGAFLYSKANEAMQAHRAPGAIRMQITPGTPTHSQKQFEWIWLKLIGACIAVMVIIGSGAPASWSQQTPEPLLRLELSRAVRPWEFLPVTGTRAALLGNESGRMEAWVYPLKIFRDFHLKFHTEGRVLMAEALARTVTVRPESASVLYAGDTFTVRETFIVPVREQGALILLDVETEQPLEIEARFIEIFSWNGQRHSERHIWTGRGHSMRFILERNREDSRRWWVRRQRRSLMLNFRRTIRNRRRVRSG